MATYRTPGVYVEEISTLPPSVAEVATAVPAFLGHTRTAPADAGSPAIARITTMLDFVSTFGGPQPAKFTVAEPADAAGTPLVTAVAPTNPFSLYYAVSHYFRNGGGPCYIVSVGAYESAPTKAQFSAGLTALEREDEPTLIVLTDAACVLSATDYYALCGEALLQCRKLGDRFTIVDVPKGDWKAFRNDANLSANLMYGAAYHPFLQTSISYDYRDADVAITRASAANTNANGSLSIGDANSITVTFTGSSADKPSVAVTAGTKTGALGFAVAGGVLTISNANSKTGGDIAAAWSTWKQANPALGFDISAAGDGTGVVTTTANLPAAAVPLSAANVATLESIKSSETGLYNKAKSALAEQRVKLPPSAAVAGVYARVDREQGVWKAPANVGVLAVIGPVAKITNDDQDQLNIDETGGKSINAIREFTGKGTLVWGGRTLAGNDNEWRYVSVRRLFIMIEESTQKASAFAVFEPNDQTTWLKVKAMIESYLYGLWQQGALAGAKPEDAYYVHVGLGTTMTADDILAGRMIVEIGVAAVRPAEFIILRFSHKLQTA
jgi:phage tail sheath protein FI